VFLRHVLVESLAGVSDENIASNVSDYYSR
jgi:hypothetical protein